MSRTVGDQPHTAGSSELVASSISLQVLTRPDPDINTGHVDHESTAADADVRLNSSATRAEPQTLTQASSSKAEEGYDSVEHGEQSTRDRGPGNLVELSAQVKLIELWLSMYGRIAGLRNLVLNSRMNANKARIQCKQHEARFDAIVEDFMGILNSTSEDSYVQIKEHLQSLSTRLRSTKHELSLVRERNSAVEDALSNHEYRLTELEGDLYRQIHKEFPHEAAKAPSPPVTSGPDDDGSSSNGERNDPRNRLYSRMSDLRIHMERLANFEHDLQAQLDEQDTVADQRFFEDARSDRENIATELEKAHQDVQRLKELCFSRGIKFYDVPFPTRNEAVSTMPPENVVTDLIPGQRIIVEDGSSTNIVETYFDKQRRTEGWLANVDDGDSSRNEDMQMDEQNVPD